MNPNYVQKGYYEEDLFKISIEKFWDMSCEKSSINDDMYNHIDFNLSNGMKVDVKSSNRIYNGTHHIWVELVNIWGKRGWIDGKATDIAFSLGDRYIIVNRIELNIFIKSKVKIGIWNWKGSNIKIYDIYRRRGKLDKIVLVPLVDILGLKHSFCKRENNG